MRTLTENNILAKLEYPPSGFILQKDVYTTNLLFTNEKYSIESLKETLPFRPISYRNISNPNSSIKIMRQNGKISDNSEEKKRFYSLSNFKPKPLARKKLKFPLPKLKLIPLSNENLYKDIKNNTKIKNLEDDLNIYSKNGINIMNNFKDDKIPKSNKINFPSIARNKETLNNNTQFKRYKYLFKKEYSDKNYDKISIRQIISQINRELKDLRQIELDRKKLFFKDKFFSTQIYA